MQTSRQLKKEITNRNILFNTCFDKNHVKELVLWFLSQHGENYTINFLESLKTIGFYYATHAGISLGIEDLEIPPEKPYLISEAHLITKKIEQDNLSGLLTSVEKSQYLIDTWNQTSDLLRNHAVQNFRTKNPLNPVYMMAFSGARGNISQVRQLVAMRGLMADPQGAILEFPIQSNFREGLTITEYLISCYGARKGLVDTALRTATSGYLTRRLVDSAQHAVISMIDCGTNYSYILEGKNLETRLVGRVLAQNLIKFADNQAIFTRNHIISKIDANLIAKKHTQILVRSSLTCDSLTSVCQFCYGWNLASGNLVQIGEAVGVIAAQAIGEPGTQLTMRTFHTGGVGVFSEQNLKPIFAPYKGKIIFFDSIPGHFIRTPYGKIVYMVKNSSTSKNKILFKIEPLQKTVSGLVIYEEDFPPGSLLLVKNGEIVDLKQVIGQASRVKLSKQKLPESSHPIYSPFEGQVFFESMNLLIEKEIPLDIPTTKKKNEGEKRFLKTKNFGMPDIRRMATIGSFWVFSAYNQHELNKINCFVESGDLVSKKTILFYYQFSTILKIQLQKINSSLTFGLPIIGIPISKITFSRNKYILNLKSLKKNIQINQKNQKYSRPNFHETILLDKYTIEKSVLLWYPAIQNKQQLFNFYSYTHILGLYTQPILKQTSLLKKQNIYNLKGSLFWLNFGNIFSCIPEIKKKYRTTNFYKKSVKNPASKRFLNLNLMSRDCILKNSDRPINYLSIDLSNQGWVYCISSENFRKKVHNRVWQFLPTGLSVTKISIPKQNVSIRKLEIRKFLIYQTNAELEKNSNHKWYNSTEFIQKHIKFQKNKIKLKQKLNKFIKPISTLKIGLFWYSRDFQFLKENIVCNIFKLKHSNFKITQYSSIFLIQTITEYTFPTKQKLHQKVLTFYTKLISQNTRNPLFCKQLSTLLQIKKQPKLKLEISVPNKSSYFNLLYFLKIQLWNNKNIDYQKTYCNYQISQNNLKRNLSIYYYNLPTLTRSLNFRFYTYNQNWIVPIKPFSSGNIHIRASGEFRYQLQKTRGTSISVLRKTDLVTVASTNFNISNRINLKTTNIGNTIRWGQELFPETASIFNGQIIKKTTNKLTIRLGIPILASKRGILHIFQNDLVFKNQLLITLKSRRLQTEDIVQGIPKIEQLFEARESQGGEILSDTVHIRLRQAFVRELELLNNNHWSVAVQNSFIHAQKFLVENIIEAYSNQGVKIAEKHVEVIVRQMTNRVRILDSGETGLLPGELVQHTWIKKFNQYIRDLDLREATYEPVVLGISKSVLQSESFLLAASFQEVSRVLVRSALSKKQDFLRGLHENVIVGQLIPAGTGLITKYNSSKYIFPENLANGIN
jgi:RNA polymerase Rpb1, domain 5/RNA polymerase Rpb1, domain 4